MKFCIVTPSLNAARFIDETIFSVLSQAGLFRIRYHVQDGGSADGTLEKLARWRRLVEAGHLLLRAKKTMASMMR
jgi:glycosyltransferase involved in cell wall biosynthesis